MYISHNHINFDQNKQVMLTFINEIPPTKREYQCSYDYYTLIDQKYFIYFKWPPFYLILQEITLQWENKSQLAFYNDETKYPLTTSNLQLSYNRRNTPQVGKLT